MFSTLICFSLICRSPPPPKKKETMPHMVAPCTSAVLKKEFKDRDPFVVVFSTQIFPYTADNFRFFSIYEFPKKT
jgi:hypothetical protein